MRPSDRGPLAPLPVSRPRRCRGRPRAWLLAVGLALLLRGAGRRPAALCGGGRAPRVPQERGAPAPWGRDARGQGPPQELGGAGPLQRAGGRDAGPLIPEICRTGAARAEEAARAKMLDALAAGDLRPGQELELVSALDLNTVVWPEVPVALKDALELPEMDRGIDSLSLNLSIAVQANDYNGSTVPLHNLTNFYFLAKAEPLGNLVEQLIVATGETTGLPHLWGKKAKAEHRRYSAEEIECWRQRAVAAQQRKPSVRTSTSMPRWAHQEACFSACCAFLTEPSTPRDFFVQIATGGGKSLIMADLLCGLNPEERACVIVPKLDLMHQMARLLSSILSEGVCCVGTGHKVDPVARVFI